MVNLRYHIVSLVAVFLALAVGIVLGAGPLQNRINTFDDTDRWEERIDELEGELSVSHTEATQYGVYLEALAKDVLPGSLPGVEVALIALPGAHDDDLKEMLAKLEQAGAVTTGTVTLTENWVSYRQREYRETLSSPVFGHLQETEGAESADQILAQALVEALTTTGPETELVKEILSDENTPLVEPETFPAKPATALVVVGPRAAVLGAAEDALDSEADADDPLGGESATALEALGVAVAGAPDGAAAYGAADTAEDFIAILRTQKVSIATADQIGTPMGALNTALALAAGGTGAYGQGIGATATLAPLP